jgi:hypothetical protein
MTMTREQFEKWAENNTSILLAKVNSLEDYYTILYHVYLQGALDVSKSDMYNNWCSTFTIPCSGASLPDEYPIDFPG